MSSKKIKWGILSTASIGTEHVIPAMMKGEYCDIIALASRNKDAAVKVAGQFGIPRAYGSYEELLLDPEIEAVYIPLPNHLHVPWSILALEAGKHVLVEKPIALSSEEARKLVDEARKYPELKVMEAFMYRHHPQWQKTKELVDSGVIGSLKTIQASFSFFEDDPESIVNKKEYGGGSLMDIGCYPISLSRFLFNAEPKKVYANIEIHPEFLTDTMATAMMEFERGSATFFSSTLMPDMQQVEVYGSKGRIVFDLPFNPVADEAARIWLYRGDHKEELTFDPCDQYTIQGDLFSLSILNDTSVPTSLQDAVDNMIVIERLFKAS